MNLERGYKTTMVGLYKYMASKNDPQIQAVLRHHNSKALQKLPNTSVKLVHKTLLQISTRQLHERSSNLNTSTR